MQTVPTFYSQKVIQNMVGSREYLDGCAIFHTIETRERVSCSPKLNGSISISQLTLPLHNKFFTGLNILNGGLINTLVYLPILFHNSKESLLPIPTKQGGCYFNSEFLPSRLLEYIVYACTINTYMS